MTNETNEGIHKFERAGLGRAPFRFIGLTEKVYQACPGAPVQPGGACAYCGEGIRYVCVIRSADGKLFDVGSTCVEKAGDAGLVKLVSRAVRDLDAKKRKEKDEATKAALADALADPYARMVLASSPSVSKFARAGETLLTHLEFILPRCGAAGRAKALKQVKAALAAAAAHAPK